MIDILFNLFNQSAVNVFKIFLLLCEFLYIGFAFVLLRQERLMSQKVEIPIGKLFHFLALVHFFASITVFIVSLLIT